MGTQQHTPSEFGRRVLIADVIFLTLVAPGAVVVVTAWRAGGASGLLSSILIGAFLIGGFVVPLLSKRKERLEEARRKKEEEHSVWGFESRDREGVWINYVDYPVVVQGVVPEATSNFYSEWLVIHEGLLVVNPGEAHVSDETVHYAFHTRKTYAWDGCTPKRWFWWLLVIGTPDFGFDRCSFQTIDSSGKLQLCSPIWQRAHLASLVHDALSQYAHCVPLTRSQMSEIFRGLLQREGISAPICWLYYFAVNMFGPRAGGGNYHSRILQPEWNADPSRSEGQIH